MRVGIRGQAPAGPIASRIHRHRRRGARIQRHAVQVDTGGPGGYRRVPFIVPFRSRRARRASLASHSFAKRACELTARARATSGRPGKPSPGPRTLGSERRVFYFGIRRRTRTPVPCRSLVDLPST